MIYGRKLSFINQLPVLICRTLGGAHILIMINGPFKYACTFLTRFYNGAGSFCFIKCRYGLVVFARFFQSLIVCLIAFCWLLGWKVLLQLSLYTILYILLCKIKCLAYA